MKEVCRSALQDAVEKKKYIPEYDDIISESLQICLDDEEIRFLAQTYAFYIKLSDNIDFGDMFWDSDEMFVDTHLQTVIDHIEKEAKIISKLMFAITLSIPSNDTTEICELKKSICNHIQTVTGFWTLYKTHYQFSGIETVGLSEEQKKPYISIFIQFVSDVRHFEPDFFKNKSGHMLPDPFDPPHLSPMDEPDQIRNRWRDREIWWAKAQLNMISL